MSSLQINIYASIGITWIAALVALIMRMLARHITRMSLWFDDYFSILAFVSLPFNFHLQLRTDNVPISSSSPPDTAPS
jgi:hypothetical protein